MVLAALGFSLVLGYAALSLTIARNGYAEMRVRQEIEDLRAQSALLRYQVHLAESSGRVHETAARLGLTQADPVRGIDYVRLPSSTPATETRLAAVEPNRERAGLSWVLSGLATGVSAGGRAEASTVSGHRR